MMIDRCQKVARITVALYHIFTPSVRGSNALSGRDAPASPKVTEGPGPMISPRLLGSRGKRLHFQHPYSVGS